MAEFASNEKGNTGVTLGGIGTALGAINTLTNGVMGGILGNGFNGNNNNNYATKTDLAYGLEDARLKAEVYADKAVDKASVFTLKEMQASDVKLANFASEIKNTTFEIGNALAVTRTEINDMKEYTKEINCLRDQLNKKDIEGVRRESELRDYNLHQELHNIDVNSMIQLLVLKKNLRVLLHLKVKEERLETKIFIVM